MEICLLLASGNPGQNQISIYLSINTGMNEAYFESSGHLVYTIGQQLWPFLRNQESLVV